MSIGELRTGSFIKLKIKDGTKDGKTLLVHSFNGDPKDLELNLTINGVITPLFPCPEPTAVNLGMPSVEAVEVNESAARARPVRAIATPSVIARPIGRVDDSSLANIGPHGALYGRSLFALPSVRERWADFAASNDSDFRPVSLNQSPSSLGGVSAGGGGVSAGGVFLTEGRLGERRVYKTEHLTDDFISSVKQKDMIVAENPTINNEYLYLEPGSNVIKKGRLKSMGRRPRDYMESMINNHPSDIPPIMYTITSENGTDITVSKIYQALYPTLHVGGKRYKKTKKTKKSKKIRKTRKTRK